MAHTISIKFEALVAPAVGNVAPICRVFKPQGCAADNECMKGTYNDTNTEMQSRGELATSFDKYIEQQVAHPGLVAALKKAVRDGEYVIKDADEKAALYAEELAPALKDQGFIIVVDAAAEEGTENVDGE